MTRLRSALLGSAVLLLGLQAPAAMGATASELFADGNRLFHEDLYWAALLRYGQAADAGMQNPLLDYNTGVAHYKAKQYQRAFDAFLKAEQYGPLQPISAYNLGLSAYRMGNTEDALRWLRQARDQDQRRDISKLAARAIDRIDKEELVTRNTAVIVEARKAERPITNLDIRLRVGAGFDDNVYRTPATSYTDVSDPNNPVRVNPVVQSGMFIPVNVSARYQVNTFENEGFFTSYRYGGRFYQDKVLNQADEYLQELALGSEFRRKDESRERRVYAAFKVAQHKDIYFDPATGVERIVNGEDISDRMSFVRYGPEFWMQEKFGPLTIGGRVKGQLWNYETVQEVPEWDHQFWLGGLNAQWRYSESSLIRAWGEYYTRRFGQRPSYELDGSQPANNPTVRYDYVEYGIAARQRITSAMWFGLNFELTDREDRHVGYNNYSRTKYSVDYNLNVGQRFDVRATGAYSNFEYENAFAFNNPAAGDKTLEIFEVSAAVIYQLGDSFELTGEYYLRDVTSSDTRIEYGRSLFMLALRYFY